MNQWILYTIAIIIYIIIIVTTVTDKETHKLTSFPPWMKLDRILNNSVMNIC